MSNNTEKTNVAQDERRVHSVNGSDVRTNLEKPLEVTQDVLSLYEFRQEGRTLTCIDNPSLSAVLPLGVYLTGERGAYRLEKLF